MAVPLSQAVDDYLAACRRRRLRPCTLRYYAMALERFIGATEATDLAAIDRAHFPAFQDAAVDILVEKTVIAVATYRARTVLLAGGVAANGPLRTRLRERLGPDIDLRYPPLLFCPANAAMIAAAAHHAPRAEPEVDPSLNW